MIGRIRRDPPTFEKYQHNKELVALVNMFADTSQDLPPNWDTKKDRNGKVLTTTFIDPYILRHNTNLNTTNTKY